MKQPSVIKTEMDDSELVLAMAIARQFGREIDPHRIKLAYFQSAKWLMKSQQSDQE
jgi:hypothetical protein